MVFSVPFNQIAHEADHRPGMAEAVVRVTLAVELGGDDVHR